MNPKEYIKIIIIVLFVKSKINIKFQLITLLLWNILQPYKAWISYIYLSYFWKDVQNLLYVMVFDMKDPSRGLTLHSTLMKQVHYARLYRITHLSLNCSLEMMRDDEMMSSACEDGVVEDVGCREGWRTFRVSSGTILEHSQS